MDSRFQEKYLEKKYKESKIFLDLFFYVGPFTFLAFWIADYFQYPEKKIEFFFVRLSFCFLVFLSYRKIIRDKSYFFNQLIMCIWTIYASLAIVYIMARTEGPASIYYSGINLVALFSLIFATLDKKFFSLILVSVYTPYYVLCYLNFDSFLNWKVFFVYNIFNCGTIFGIVMTRIRREKDFVNLLNTEISLENELKSRELVIIKKTEEATKLHQLSSQFSPQIIRAIRNGQININEEVKRSEICALFIDIVKSTDKVTKLPEKDMQLSLARFLDVTLTTFLKYDLTIDKFHGDGILAFSNMPVQRTDFITRTCLAALETLDLIHKDNAFYLKHWKSELQVRVGIAVGFANVGFYGDQKYFKTFTAIGAPLPYASRLTSIGEPNQILIDHNIAQIIIKQGFKVRSIGFPSLKGFEDNIGEVFNLIALPDATIKNSPEALDMHILASKEKEFCSIHKNSVLFLDTDDKGHYYFKCRDCDIEEVIKAS
jgi:class 3 adenylate cyclase